jgi:MFS family permease
VVSRANPQQRFSGLFGLATLAGRLLAGYMVDRIFAPHVASVFFLAPIAGFVFLGSAAGPMPAVGVVLFGLGLGTEIDLIAFLVSRYFGQRSFGELYGYFFMVFGLGSSFGRFLGGLCLRPDGVLQRRLYRRRCRPRHRSLSSKSPGRLRLPGAPPHHAAIGRGAGHLSTCFR